MSSLRGEPGVGKSRVAYVERPYQALLELLKSKGIYALGSRVWLHRKRVEELGFQYVAVEALVREYDVYYDNEFKGREYYKTVYKGSKFKLLLGPGEERAQA